ncbi:MAG: VOC family protein [Alphaproteobacteria bacterium]|nr:VOC family protein [Alphaproteobacteria bacterium]
MQKTGKILQMAYVVDDLETAARNWVEMTGSGPMFIGVDFPIINRRYRGEPTEVELSLALGFSDGLCIEYIYQKNDVPSIYNDRPLIKPIGFHHWGIMTRDLEAAVADWQAKGCEKAFEGEVGVGGRFVYMDTVAKLGGMIELIEVNQKVEDFFAFLEQSAVDWDGTDPVRYL